MSAREILVLVILMMCAVGMVSGAPTGRDYDDAEDEDLEEE